MKHTFTLVALLMAIYLLSSSCAQETKISEQSVSRIIKTLSSDEMKGRHAFRDEINAAADFISSEFEQIGLSPLPGHDSFLQEFTIYSLKATNTSVTINNKSINEDYCFGLITKEELNWTEEDIQISYISENDDYREKFHQFSDDDQSSVIVIDKAHKKWFHRYRSYFIRSNRVFELGTKPNDVFILYDGSVNTLDVYFKYNIESINLFNVAGMIEGERKDEIVLFSAHYDHIGIISPVNQDSIANGANDNASGVAAVIELASYFESKPKPVRTIYFVGFTAEEVGGYGSKYFSRQFNSDEIMAMFNIEMIGKPAVEGPNSAWITGFEYSTFGEILQNSVTDSSFVFYPDPYPNQNLFNRSDNTPFAMLGVPAHSISTTPIDVDQDYHQVTDELNTLDLTHTTNTIRAISKAAETIISGEQTPTRISPDSLN